MPFPDYQNCRLCPRQCGADRAAGKTGVCRETAVCRIASFGPHRGEEPSISGTRGSGTIFFSGCSSRCFFCQNHQISLNKEGRKFSEQELLDAALALIGQGVHNLNFVTPDHFWPHIEALCVELRRRGESIPFLFNSSGNQDERMLSRYAAHMDIFLPDFKFADADLAAECMGDRRYPDLALAALRKMVEAKGFLDPWDPTGRETARRGVLVRHLVLPGHIGNSLRVLRLLCDEFGPRLPLSVMSQFQPMPECQRRGQLTEPVRPEDYRQVCDLCAELGFERAYIQPELGDPDFVPDFARRDPFRGNRKCPIVSGKASHHEEHLECG